MNNQIELIPVEVVDKTLNVSLNRREFLKNAGYLLFVGLVLKSEKSKANPIVTATFLLALAQFGLEVWKYINEGEGESPEFNYYQYQIICVGCGSCVLGMEYEPGDDEESGEMVLEALEVCPVKSW